MYFVFQVSVEKWNLYNSSRVHVHRPSCVAQEIQRLNALELEKKIGKSVLGKVGWVCWYCFIQQGISCIYYLHGGVALLAFIWAVENNTSIPFCHLPMLYKWHLSSGTHEFHLLLALQHLGSFGKYPAVVNLHFQRHHTGRIQWDGCAVPDPHTLHIGKAELLKTGSMDWFFYSRLVQIMQMCIKGFRRGLKPPPKTWCKSYWISWEP